MTAIDRLDAIEARSPHDRVGRAQDRSVLIDALRAVLALHHPVWSAHDDAYRCFECYDLLTDASPDCPTVAVLTAALDAAS